MPRKPVVGAWGRRAGRALGGGASAMVLAAALVGCASTPTGPLYTEAEVAIDQSRVYVFRSERPREPREIAVWINGGEIAPLAPGEYLTVPVEPGEHIVRALDERFGSAARGVELAPGESAWLELGFHEFSDALWVFRPPVPDAREQIKAARLTAMPEVTEPIAPVRSLDDLMRDSESASRSP